MSTDLTREQALEAYRDTVQIVCLTSGTRRAFLAGWSARDAEVERLRAACEAAMSEATAIETRLVRYGSQDIHLIGNSAITIQNILQAALVGEVTK